MTYTPDDLITARLMLAFDDLEPPDTLFERIRGGIAGLTLFRAYNYDNPAQLRQLTARLQHVARAAGRPPLLIAADQEGGQLTALGEGATPFAGNMALGAAGDPALARRVGRAIGYELAALGVNVNYGPVLDLATEPRNPAVGTRAFGDDPALAATLGAAWIDGLQSAGVAATLKHFPGLGGATLDSHHALPLLDYDRERLARVELPPFRAGIAAGARLLMTGHAAVPALSGAADRPATVAGRVLHDLVRNELGFRGVTISDALDMAAITQGAGQIVEVIAALRAGIDLLLLTADEATHERLHAGLRLAHSRELFDTTDLSAPAQRIRALRAWVAGPPQPGLDVVGCAAHRALEAELASRALTLVRDDAGLLPLRPGPETRIAAVMPQPRNLTPADTSAYLTPQLAAALRRHHPRVDEFTTAHAPDDDEIADLRARLADYDLLVLGTTAAATQPQQAALAHALLAIGVPTVAVALRAPFDLLAYPEATTQLATYSLHRPSLDALADALFGHLAPTGRLPVAIGDRAIV